MSSYRYSFLIFCVGAWLAAPLQADTFADFLQQALKQNHGLRAEYQNWQAQSSDTDASGFLPEPMITYDYNFQPDAPGEKPRAHELMLEQKLPWFGTRSLQKTARQQESEAAYWQWQSRRLELQQQAAELYGDLYYWHQSVAISRRNLGLLQELEAIARARYRVASAQHADLVRIQLELGKAADALISLEQQRPALHARIATLLGNRSQTQPLQWPQQLPEPPPPDIASLEQQLPQHPLLRQQAFVQRSAQTAVDLADKRYGPEVTLRYGHMFINESSDPMMQDGDNFPEYVGIAISAPIWFSQYDALKKSAHSRALAARDTGNFMLDQLHGKLQQAQFQLQDAERKRTLYREDLIPRAEESLQAQLRAYQTGAVGFLELLDAEKLLLELQLQEAKSQADRWQAHHMLLLAGGRFYHTQFAEKAP